MDWKRKSSEQCSEQFESFAGNIKCIERGSGGFERSVFQNDFLSKILRGIISVFGMYLLIQSTDLILRSSNWGYVLQNPSYVLSSFFGFLLILAAIVPGKFVKNHIVSPPSTEIDNFFISMGDRRSESVKRNSGISWMINYPENLPNPMKVKNSSVYDFLIEVKVENNTKNSLELKAQVESLNQGIAFISSNKEEKWEWLPIPHKEADSIGLKDQVETRVLGEGDSTRFHFHAVYRPQFSTSFFPGYLPLNYVLKGEFSSGESFSSGIQRIELPFVGGGF